MMYLSFLGILSLFGFVRAATPPSTGCYTQPPGRRSGNRVMSCVDKYAVLPDNLFCLKNIQRHQIPDDEKDKIVKKHNERRTSVLPKAANMLTLNYNKGLERTAQIWAETCQLQQSKPMQRFRPGSFQVGENIYVSKTNKSWSDVIDIWTQENASFTFGSSGNDPNLVSNYAQIIWAKTSAVGCSKAMCSGQYFYVCHYAPGMSGSNTDTPYVSSKISCSQCPSNCTNSLCECSGIICLNGAELNYKTCQCDCIPAVKTYIPPTCELHCDKAGDDSKCGSTYSKSTCLTNIETIYHCPWLCDVCPYAGKNYTDRSVNLPWEQSGVECTTTPATTTRSTQSPQSTNLVNQGGTTPRRTTKAATRQIISTTAPAKNPTSQGTTKGTHSSDSEQMNGQQCGNNSSTCISSSQWIIVLVFMTLLDWFK